MHDGLKPCQFRQVDANGRILCHLIKGGDREVSVNLCRACPVQQINCQHLRAGLEKRVSTPITVRFATGRVEVWDDAPPAIDFKQAACAVKTMPIHSPRDCTGCPLRLPNVIPQNAIQVAHHSRQTPAVAAAPAAAAPAHTAARSAVRAPRTAEAATKSRTPVPSEPPRPAASPVAQSDAVTELVARARAVASKQAQARPPAQARPAAQARENYTPPAGESKSKIIQLQAWLSGQLNRKQVHQPLPVEADEDGVSEIVYAPLNAQVAQAYHETTDYERCVGWTD